MLVRWRDRGRALSIRSGKPFLSLAKSCVCRHWAVRPGLLLVLPERLHSSEPGQLQQGCSQ
eukprot:scaffold648777_cov46-Prasinocladus_malaysianus.AAC.1